MKILGKAAIAAGAVAGGVALKRALETKPRYEAWERKPFKDFENRVLIVGGGFAGFATARELCRISRDRTDIGVMLVSKENYFTFWPMLAGIISSDVEARNIAQPIRRALIHAGASFRRAELTDVNPEKKTIKASSIELPYDHLVIALGATPAYFGIPGVEEYAISIKGIGAGEEIRNRVIERYEEVSLEGKKSIHGRQDPRLTFVVIGGGATGVETAAEMHHLVHDTLSPDYPNIDARNVRIVLVDSNPEVLKELDPALRKVARRKLDQLDIEVRNKVRAKEITADKVLLNDGTEIESHNVIWTAGTRASETLDSLPFDNDERRGLPTDVYMRVSGREDVWSIGDCASNVGTDGEAVPPNAQAAVQEGKALAHNLLAAIDGRDLKPFEYHPMGQLVEIGSEYAVNDVMGVKFSGLLAAVFWRATYLYKLESPQSRVRVALDWVLDLAMDPAVSQIRR